MPIVRFWNWLAGRLHHSSLGDRGGEPERRSGVYLSADFSPVFADSFNPEPQATGKSYEACLDWRGDSLACGSGLNELCEDRKFLVRNAG